MISDAISTVDTDQSFSMVRAASPTVVITTNPSHAGLAMGALAGIVFAAILLLICLLLASILLFIYRNRKRQKLFSSEQTLSDLSALKPDVCLPAQPPASTIRARGFEVSPAGPRPPPKPCCSRQTNVDFSIYKFKPLPPIPKHRPLIEDVSTMGLSMDCWDASSEV